MADVFSFDNDDEFEYDGDFMFDEDAIDSFLNSPTFTDSYSYAEDPHTGDTLFSHQTHSSIVSHQVSLTESNEVTEESHKIIEKTIPLSVAVPQFTSKDCDLCTESNSTLMMAFNSIYLCEVCVKRVCPAHVFIFLDENAEKPRTMCSVCRNEQKINKTKVEKAEKIDKSKDQSKDQSKNNSTTLNFPILNQVSDKQKSNHEIITKKQSKLVMKKQHSAPIIKKEKSRAAPKSKTIIAKKKSQTTLDWMPVVPKTKIKINKSCNK